MIIMDVRLEKLGASFSGVLMLRMCSCFLVACATAIFATRSPCLQLEEETGAGGIAFIDSKE